MSKTDAQDVAAMALHTDESRDPGVHADMVATGGGLARVRRYVGRQLSTVFGHSEALQGTGSDSIHCEENDD